MKGFRDFGKYWMYLQIWGGCRASKKSAIYNNDGFRIYIAPLGGPKKEGGR